MGTITSRVTTRPAPPACAAASCASARAPTPVPRSTQVSSAAARRRTVTRSGSIGLLTQAFIDQAERGVDVVLVHYQRRGKPQGALPRAEQQQALPEGALHELVRNLRGGVPRSAVLDELDTDHQAPPPHLPDRTVLLLQPLHAGEQTLTQARHIGQQLALHYVERGERRRAAHRVPAEGAAVRPRLPLHDRFFGDDRADRHAAAEPLRREQHVGLDPLVLARPHLAGPPHAALHLVAHQQDAVAVAQLAQRLQVARRRHHVPALALDRLHEDRGHALRVEPLGEQVVLDGRHVPHRARGLSTTEIAVVAIAVWDVIDLGKERREAGTLDRLAGG